VEESIIAVVRKCSVMLTIELEIKAFVIAYGVQPELIQIKRSLKGAFIRELLQSTRFTRDDTHAAIIEPVWFDEIPALFNLPEKGELYLKLQHNGIKKERTL
jgi:hypothetical protein